MKRRDFLKAGPALSLPLLLGGFDVTAAARNPLLQLLREQTANNGKVLVLIQMTGGNDGLNTLIPLDQYSQLMNARGNIVIPSNKVLGLNGLSKTGLHPALAEVQGLYNNGQVNIVQAVSYPNQTFSHFRATDIWFTGSAADQYLNTGWLGRTLESSYAGYPANYPSSDMPDPLAIQIGSQASLVTQCTTINTAVTVNDPNTFYKLVSGNVADAPDTPYGHELTFLRLIRQQTNSYTTVVSNAFNNTTNLVSYPDNELASQLKIIARLIKGGLKTPVYVVNHPDSFDTHANQVDIADTSKGAHANMLATLSQSVNAFQKDLVSMGISDRVASMTFTEFGRRIKSNDSMGSDHGAATPIFFFGSSLNPVTLGINPVIPATILPTDQVNMQFDFRSVYYTVLKDWFELSAAQLSTVLPGQYNTLPIFKLVALPVELLSFTGNWLSNKVNLQWKVDQESGIDHYEIQRAEDGNNFVKLSTVNAVNSSTPYTYSFTDASLSRSLYYYRIKIVEKSAALKFSAVLLLKTSQQAAGMALKIFPNPVTDGFTVSFDNKIAGPVSVRIIDLTGKEIWKQEKEMPDAYNLRFSFGNKKPAAGLYMLKLLARNEEASVKIMVQ